MIRLYFLCLLIDLKVAQNDTGQGHLLIAPLFSEVNIYKQSPCPTQWRQNYKEINTIFHTTETSYGVYLCSEPQQFLYLVKSETDLTLTVTPEGGVIGDKLILTCGITLFATDHEINCNLKIFDSSEVELAENNDLIPFWSRKNTEVNVSSFELFETGYQIVYCQGYFVINYEKMTGGQEKSTNATIQTYNFPTNVTPDMTEVTVGGTVICQPDFADPPAKHVWSCLGDGWSSNGALLTLNVLGELNCSCSIISVLHGVSHEITWSGIIRVIVGGCSSIRIPQLYIAILFLASNQIQFIYN